MRIAIYQPWVYVHGGMERLLLETISRSTHEWVVFTSHYNPEGTFSDFQNHHIKEIQNVSVKRDLVSVLHVAVKVALQKLPLEGFDALVVMCDGIGDLITLRNSEIPTMTICCTPLRPVFDEVYRMKAVEHKGKIFRLLFTIFGFGYKLIDRIIWRRYSRVVAISAETKRRIIKGKLFKDNNRLKILNPGIDIYSISTDVTYESFFFLPGRIMWTKNIEMAIKAFSKADLPSPWKLVIAGYLDVKSVPYYKQLKLLAKNQRVEFVLSPTDKDLFELYQRTSCVLFTALNEDWGITPLEGMAHSKPIIATAKGGPMESIIDGETGWLLKPEVEAWRFLFRDLVNKPELFIQMGKKARIHCTKFDWRVFIESVDGLLDELVIECNNRYEQKERKKEQFHSSIYFPSKITT